MKSARGLLLVVFSMSSLSAAQAAMTTPGQFAVEGGAAIYTVPIQVPPGIAGMEPKIALNYNSQSGNGLLGMGWNLSGLSSIVRCPRTLVSDGVRGSVNYDGNDRYCLDGQRLINVSGSYGADGTEYRTENESFLKIVSYGQQGQGPAWFKVWSKSGVIREYGKTADSRIEAVNQSTVAVWAHNRTLDTKGNFIDWRYAENNTFGQWHPLEIQYAGNATTGSPASTKLVFEYEDRPDKTNNSRGSLTVRLASISAITDGVLNNKLLLNYSQSNISTRSLVNTVRQCNGSGTCLPPVQFKWSGAIQPQSWTFQGHAIADLGWTFADIFGDGRKVYYTHSGDGHHYASRFNPDGSVQNWDWWGHGNAGSGMQMVDLFGDGRQVYWTHNTAFDHYVTRMNDDGTVQNWTFQGHAIADLGWELVDIFGDGRKVYYTHGGDGHHFASRFNPDGSVQNWDWWGHGNAGSGMQMVDLFGDGRQVYWTHNGQGQHYVQRLNDDGTTQGWTFQGHYIADLGWEFVDLFGDGRKVYYTHGGDGHHFASRFKPDGTVENWDWWGHGNAGSGMQMVDLFGDGRQVYWTHNGQGQHYVQRLNDDGTTQGWTFQGHYIADLGWEFVDLFGDGRKVYYTHGSDGHHYATRFNPDGTVQNWDWWGHGHGGAGMQMADLFGDGRQVYWTHNDAFDHSVTSFASGTTDLLLAVTTGFGHASSVEYKPLPQLLNSRYTKDLPNSYPKTIITPPLPVVITASTSDGVGGTRTSQYWYGNFAYDYAGRGFLGFNWVRSQNTASGIIKQTHYRQDFPYTGVPFSEGTWHGNWSLLSVTDRTHDCVHPGTGAACSFAPGQRYMVREPTTLTRSWDLNGVALPQTRTTQTLDLFGNPTQIKVETLTPTGGATGYSKTTNNQYSNDTSNWFLGRLTRSSVTSVSP